MKGKRSNGRGLNSFMLVNELLKLKEDLLTEASYDLISQFKSIEVDGSKIYDLDTSKCCRPIENKKDDKENNTKRIMFDCETYRNKYNKHIPYMVSMIDDDEVKSFIGDRCFDDFLSHIADKYGDQQFKNATKLELYAHNSTYDGSFMMKKLMNLQILEKDSRYVSMKGMYMNSSRKFVELLVKDSYRLIPMRLSEIPGACGFKDEAQKEVMYYAMYNYNTMDSITN